MAMSGLEVLQDIDWGTHLCQFYGSRQEYLEVIVPFFSAGFERNHLCLLMASEELGIEEVLEFLRGRLEGIEARMEKGQIEVVSRKEIPTGRLAEFLSDRLRLATENGFSGIRLALDVRPKSEEEFMAVFGADDAIEHVIQGRKIVALCSFCSVGMGPLEIIGVIGRHRIALVRRGDRWLSLESPKLTGTEAALAELRSQATIDDKVRGLVVEGIFRDITNRKRAEDAVTQLNDVLKLINKTMRHDILNELTVISGSLEVFADTRSEKFLANARRAVERCVELTKRMKELESFVSSGTGLRPFRVREIIDKVLHAYSVSFSVEGDCTIMADEAFLSVIDNLVRNAIVHGKTERIEVKIASYGTGCEVRIADFGEGVPDKIKGKLFAEGFSYGEHRGSGLGLYLVKKTMERYGGSVTIEDNNPRGSIFILQSVVAPQENS